MKDKNPAEKAWAGLFQATAKTSLTAIDKSGFFIHLRSL